MSALAGGSEWAACVAVARHALQSHKNKDGMKLTWALAGCAITLAILAIMVGGKGYKAPMLGVSLMAGMLVFVLWVAVFKSLMAQNAMSAALVPGIGRRSLKVLAFVWGGATVGLTVLFAQSGLPVVVAAIAVALVLIFAALSMIRPVPAALMLVTMIAINNIHRHLMPVSQGQVLGVCILLSLLGAFVLVRTMLGGKSPVFHDFTSINLTAFGELRAPRTAINTLKRDCTGGNTAALLLHSLGPFIAKPPTWLVMALILLMALGFALTLAVPSLGAAYGPVTSLQTAMPASFIASMLTHAYGMGASLRRTAGEQGLIMLSSRRPEVGAINQILGRALMVRFGYQWLLMTVLLVGLSAIFGASAEQLGWMLAMCLTALAGGTLLLQNYAKAKNDNPTVPVLLALGAAVTFVVSILAKTSLVLGASFVAVWATIALVSFALRWRAMLRAPVAFPVRRLT